MASRKPKPTKFVVLLILGLLLLASGAYLSYQKTILSFSEVPVQAQEVTRGELPTEIVISSAGIDLAIEMGTINNGIWEISETMASYLASSGKIGQSGNVVIYGHNKTSIFGSLTKVKVGDKITLKSEKGNLYDYQVEEISTVKPTEVSVIAPTSYEVLTVYTCTGILDSKRLVIRATPTE